jgi:hypothetical protein
MCPARPCSRGSRRRSGGSARPSVSMRLATITTLRFVLRLLASLVDPSPLNEFLYRASHTLLGQTEAAMPRGPSDRRPIQWVPWTVLAVGVALVAFGMYWILHAAYFDLVYALNPPVCSNPMVVDCGLPPVSVFTVLGSLAGLFVLLGVVPLVAGIAQLRSGRKGRLATSTA